MLDQERQIFAFWLYHLGDRGRKNKREKLKKKKKKPIHLNSFLWMGTGRKSWFQTLTAEQDQHGCKH